MPGSDMTGRSDDGMDPGILAAIIIPIVLFVALCSGEDIA